MIKTNSIQKVFRTEEVETWALHNVSLEVKEGEFVAIMGPSGCGKSTLLNILGLLDNPTNGTYELLGTNVAEFNEDRRTQLRKGVIGFVFQSFNLIEELSVYENIELPLIYMGVPKAERKQRIQEVMRRVDIAHREKHFPKQLSGGQQQRVAIARAIVNNPEVLLLDEPLAALDLKMRKDMQMELKELHKSLGVTFVYVTHDQEEALTLSDTIVVMSEGKIQQIGTPIDIYNEPINAFVADFIGESNILNGVMLKDKLVSFAGQEFECVDEGFGENMPVDVVVRPEDIYIFDPSDAAQLTGKVTSCIFKGVHYEMLVQTTTGYELMVQDYNCFEAGREVGLLVKPFDIHVMKKERTCNTFEGRLVDENHVEFLGQEFECMPVKDIEPGATVKVEVDFNRVILQDNEEDGMLTGDVNFILYKGDHYHLTVRSDWDEDVFVDTNDVWDDGDRVGITIAAEDIRVIS